MKAIRAILLLLALGLPTYGQAVSVTANKIKGSATAPSGACSAQQVQLTTAGVVYVCASGTWTSSGGGTTINSTNGQVPYRVNSTTFGDSAFASNALNSTYLSATSGASGAGLTLTVAGGGTNENLILTAKGTGAVVLPNGASATPALVFAATPLNGFYRTAGATVTLRDNGNATPIFRFEGSDGRTVSIVGNVSKITVNNNYEVNGNSTTEGGYFSPINTNATVAYGAWTGNGSTSGIMRLAAAAGSTGAGQLLIGTSTDTADAQLSVYSQSTTRPSLKLRALSGTSSSQNVFESYSASGTLSGAITSGGAFLARGTLDYTNPEYSFSTDTNTGMAWRSADIFSLVAGGNEIFRITGAAADGLGSTIGASNGGKLGLGNGGGFDVLLERDAANTLAQRNGTNAQALRVYQTYTDSSNYARLNIAYDGVNAWQIVSANAGTGAATNLDFGNNNSAKWRINTSGSFLAIADNTYDIGASGTTRPRNIYVAGITTSGTGFITDSGGYYQFTSRGYFSASADGVFLLRNSAATDFSRLQFGGTSASFPSLKRSSAELQVVLADDTGFAATQSLYIRYGSGTPEGAVTAPVGAIYSRTDGGAGTSFYVKESGSGTNTGWVAK